MNWQYILHVLTQSGILVQFIHLAVHSIHTKLVPETF